MRRFATGLLLFLFIGQSSAASFAGENGSRGTSSVNWWSDVALVIGSVNPWPVVVGLVTGESSYTNDSGGAPRPTHFDRYAQPASVDMSPTRLVKMHYRQGREAILTLPNAAPDKRVIDRRAMRLAEKARFSQGPANAGRVARAAIPQMTQVPTAESIRSRNGSQTAVQAAPIPAPLGPQLFPGTSNGKNRGGISPQIASTDVGAGINPWWTYQERSLPGIGRAMVNIGTGNLAIQATDINIPEAGLNLALQRTYNSRSLHDANGDDGSEPATFGNGWTNTYDAHLVFQSNGNISVYDINGTRCDYSPTAGGTWQACTGQHAQLFPDGANPCSYWWTKKNGTQYYFYSPAQTLTCNTAGSNIGRLYKIVGRNTNNFVTLTYSWVPNEPETSQYLTQLVVAHSDGQSLTMTFAQAGGSGPNEISEITYPNPNAPPQNIEVRYSYDAQGDLLEVDRPGNDATLALGNGVPQLDAPETYSGQPLQEACGPRATIASWNTNNPQSDGACVKFDYDANLNLVEWDVAGILNPVNPGDGQTTLQTSAPTGWRTWYKGFFAYGATSECTNSSSGTTTMCDTDLHGTQWTINNNSSVTKAVVYTNGSPASLTTHETWDANNNLVATVDANQNETDYAYDGNGNTLAVGLPAQTTGKSRPTSVYAYDGFNNVTAYCSPTYSDHHALDWPASGGWPQGNTCKGGVGTTHYAWQYPASEPYGQIQYSYTACYNNNCLDTKRNVVEPGYNYGYFYFANGLVKQVVGGGGTSFQQLDNSQRTPVQDFTYDAYGNVQTYDNGGGTWTMKYDSLNRLLSRQDPDPGLPTSHFTYNADGSLLVSMTPYQYSLDQNGGYGNAYAHDADGDIASEVFHRKGTQGTIYKYYDGLDRLISVTEPHDNSYDLFQASWITRYYYDLTMGHQVNFNGVSFSAYGNLFKTVEWLPSSPGSQETYSGTTINNSNQAFEELKGTQYDGLDRATASYAIINGSNAIGTSTYDGTVGGTSYLGLLTEQCEPPPTPQVTECKKFAYDNDNELSGVTYLDGTTSSRIYGYDLDGHRTTSTNGDGTATTSYDLEGRVTNSQEGTHGTSPAIFTHELYPDGTLKQIDIDSAALTDTGNLYAYSYNTQGSVQTQSIVYSPTGVNLVNAYGYTPADRLNTKTESKGSMNPSMATSTWNYDHFGQLSSIQYPGGSLSPYKYDPEADVTQAGSQQFLYSIRGELNSTQPPLNNFFGAPSAVGYANGVQVQEPSADGGTFASTWDVRMGTMVSTSVSPTQDNASTSSFIYDGAGRLTGTGTFACNYNCDGSGNTSMVISSTDTYDGDNHLTQTNQTRTYSGWGLSHRSSGSNSNLSAYDWGPNDHPVRIGSANSSSGPTYDTLHWDGDQLLFVTNSSGVVDDIKIGTMADITPLDSTFSGISSWDRGPGGAVVYCHNSSGQGGAGEVANSSWQTSNAFSPCLTQVQTNQQVWTGYPHLLWANGPDLISQNIRVGGVGQGGLLGMYRTDGMADGDNTIQGARAVDPTLGTWTTPDAFAGIVGDPKTQKSYMWNGNNPISYEDPNGYAIQGGGGIGFDGGTWINNGVDCDGAGCGSGPGLAAPAEGSSTGGSAPPQQSTTPGPQAAPAPDFQCGPCAPLAPDPVGQALLLVGLGFVTDGLGDVALLAEGSELTAQSALAGPALAGQLARESAESAFTAEGGLSEGAISGSRMIVPGAQLRNAEIPAGMDKFSTSTYQSPSGNFQIHFYMNSTSGATFYGLDFKAVFSGVGGP
jgi:YD repeat-containing protein